MFDQRIAITLLASVLGHAVLARALEELPPRPVPARTPTKITVNVVEPPPKPPEPPPIPEPTPTPTPTPPPPVPEPPRIKPTPKATPRPQPTTPTPTPSDSPAAPTDVTVPASDARPKFGVSMSSTSSAGKTEAPVGNTSRPTDTRGPAGDARPLAPAAAHEVTKMPLPQGRCAGKYTEAAKAAGLEGVVVLDLVVDETGKARDITVVQGLDHGLTEAAIAALRTCQFTPGERGGEKVPVRVRGFKIRFLLEGG